jgi:hypothetical protein
LAFDFLKQESLIDAPSKLQIESRLSLMPFHASPTSVDIAAVETLLIGTPTSIFYRKEIPFKCWHAPSLIL